VKLTAFFASLLICGAAAARDVGQIPPDTDSKTLTWFRMSKSPSSTGNGFSVSFDFSYAACQCIIGDFEEGLEKATTGERRANPRRKAN
jgi:hypothetical protein